MMTPEQIERHKALLQEIADAALKIGTTESFREMSNMWGHLEGAFAMVDGHVEGGVSGENPDDENRAEYLDNLISLAGLAIAMAADEKADQIAKGVGVSQ
jgi:hypothetical protein